jgi:hypothetical protein
VKLTPNKGIIVIKNLSFNAAKAILSCSGKPLLGQTIIMDWVVPKLVFTTDESSAKERECNIGELVKSIETGEG